MVLTVESDVQLYEAQGPSEAHMSLGRHDLLLSSHALGGRSLWPVQSLPGFTRHKAYRKRASGRAQLMFPGGFRLAVSMYSLVQPATKGSPVFLNAVNNEPLKVESAFIDQDTGTRPAASLFAFTLVLRPFRDAHCAWLWGKPAC